jgi:hypothetical protein
VPTAWIPPKHAVVIGMTESGKTFRVRAWTRALPRVLYLAPKIDPDEWRGWTLVDARTEPLTWGTGRFAIAARMDAGTYGESVAVLLDTIDANENDPVFQNLVVIVDDVEHALPDASPALSRAYFAARHQGVRIWTLAHRCLGIPRAATSPGVVVLFRTAEPTDLIWCKRAGLPESRIARLGEFEALVREPSGRLRIMDRHGVLRPLSD